MTLNNTFSVIKLSKDKSTEMRNSFNSPHQFTPHRGKRDVFSPDTVIAESFEGAHENELQDVDIETVLPVVNLTPGRLLSPLPFVVGGVETLIQSPPAVWCSPSRVLVETSPCSPVSNTNGITAIPLELSFDSACGHHHRNLLHCRETLECRPPMRPSFVSVTAFTCGRDGRSIGLTINCVHGRLVLSAIGNGIFSGKPPVQPFASSMDVAALVRSHAGLYLIVL